MQPCMFRVWYDFVQDIHTYIHTYIRTYTHTYTHIHTLSLSSYVPSQHRLIGTAHVASSEYGTYQKDKRAKL